MIKRELKTNFKSFLIWTCVIIFMFLIAFLIYPSIMNSENVESINEMMKIFSPELLKAFNMDLSSIETAFGWLKTEGFVFVLLIVGTYSGILGSSILIKEENDKTIEYLNSVPLTRKQIIINKILCGMFYIILMVLCVGIFNYVGLSLSCDFDKKVYLLLSLTPLLPALCIYFICLFISTFFHKTKKTLAVSLGIVFISYFFNMISEMSNKVEYLKYVSVFTLADIRNVISNARYNPIIILISISLMLLLIVASIIHYERKELV